jgi:hypothetical protein
MLLKGFSRGGDGGVTESWTSISWFHAESVSTRKTCTLSITLSFISFILKYNEGTHNNTAKIDSKENTVATPIKNFPSDIFIQR